MLSSENLKTFRMYAMRILCCVCLEFYFGLILNIS